MGDFPINEHLASEILETTVNQFAKYVSAQVKNVNQNQFDALVSFAYNIGQTGFKVSTLLKMVNDEPNNPAIRVQFMRWDKSKGNILPGLVARRHREADLYFS